MISNIDYLQREGSGESGLLMRVRDSIAKLDVTIDFANHSHFKPPSTREFCIIANKTHGPCDHLVMLQTFSVFDFELTQFFNGEIPAALAGDPAIHQVPKKQLNILNRKQFREQTLLTIQKELKKGRTPGIIMEIRDVFLGFPHDERVSRTMVEVIRELKINVLPVFLKYETGKRQYTVRTGAFVPSETLARFKSHRRALAYLQSTIFALGSALKINRFYFAEDEQDGTQRTISPPVEQHLLEEDISSLTFKNLIASRGRFQVFLCKTPEIPNLILEIGRLREITFRTVGEGTGKSHDLDEFDLYYYQLIIWDKEAKRIAGGYRLGKGEEIYHRYGKEGFYIASFFTIRKGFLNIMKQSVELGRSYVVGDYQKQPLPLFLLWKGILSFILGNPEIKYIYGPVSISKFYSDVSKSLIVAFVKKHFFDHRLAKFVTPKKPFDPEITQVDVSLLVDSMEDLHELDNLIEQIEPAHIKIPILLKQYVKQNAKFISFNLDPNFSDALDGLMILDLRNVPIDTLEALQKENQ